MNKKRFGDFLGPKIHWIFWFQFVSQQAEENIETN